MGTRYTSEQLREIAKPFEEYALEALEARDQEQLEYWLGRMESGHAGLDALSGHTLARKVSKLRRDLGEARAREALLKIGSRIMESWVRQFREGDEKGAIIDLIAVYKYQYGTHLSPLEEDDETISLHLSPCGTAGRLQRDGLPAKHPEQYGGWSDGANSMRQLFIACEQALGEALGEPVWSTRMHDDGEGWMRFRKIRNRGQRLLDAHERQLVVQTRVQQARARLAAGDWDIAPLLRGQRKEWMPWHDFGVVLLELFYATALEIGGPDYLDELLMETYAPAFEAKAAARYAALDDEELARASAATWNYHITDFTLYEEEDRFVFITNPCGSGGRLFRGEIWRDLIQYGQSMAPLTDEPHNINFNRSRFPLYCAHCAASNRAQLQTGPKGKNPLFFIIDGHAQIKEGMPCRMFAYKKDAPRERLDPRLPEQIGITAWSDSNKISPREDEQS